MKTRDCQVDMSVNETLLSERSIQVLQNRGEDYLLEVFRPWDTQEQRWADSDTLQLRYETQDLLIGRDPDQSSENRQWEAFSGIEGVHQGSTDGLVGDCVCWLVDHMLVEEPGIHGSVFALAQQVLTHFVSGGHET